jgi:hypothetical protein
MKKLLLLSLILSKQAMAGGYYYPVPANPQPLQYVLPPAYIVPPQNYYPSPPVYIQPIQRGYIPPPPEGWANSKIVPLPPKVDLLPND